MKRSKKSRRTKKSRSKRKKDNGGNKLSIILDNLKKENDDENVDENVDEILKLLKKIMNKLDMENNKGKHPKINKNYKLKYEPLKLKNETPKIKYETPKLKNETPKIKYETPKYDKTERQPPGAPKKQRNIRNTIKNQEPMSMKPMSMIQELPPSVFTNTDNF